ncbi:MAG: hypothetical protein JWM12_939, partial [Ilumatobacteraceae bacterium]|nr:hypothetical protein [Ilumatobacteraceae bacterium]
QAAVGSTVDSNDSGNINGSRFITGLRAGAVASISVFVAGPIDHAPNDKFQLAIYDDAHGAPHHRVAATASGSLVADAWNTLPIDAVLRPQTAYWMMYNSNGSRAEVNNPTFTPVNGNLIDDAVRSHRSPRLHDIADRITAVGDNIPTTVALIVLCALVVRRRRRAAVLLVAGFGAALLIALLLRETVFSPYGLYPSGHALRTTYVAVALAFVVPRRGARVVGALLVAAVALAAVYVGGHHADEVVGGSLLGWAMATAATAFATKPTRAPAPSPVTGAPAPAAATTDRGHEARADETVGV